MRLGNEAVVPRGWELIGKVVALSTGESLTIAFERS
jgi:hypothetical protein